MSLMPQTPFQWFVPATTGTGLVPAAGYKAKFYVAGTANVKAIYTDPELTVPYPSPSNTAVLDAEGRALIYLAAGGYKLAVCMPDDTPVYTQDNINGGNSFGTGFAANFADLALVNTVLNQYCYIPGYYTAGDGGHGMFYLAVSGTAADGGYVQSSTDVDKRWFRVPDENGQVRAASFGYTPTDAGDKTDKLLAADAYATSLALTLSVKSGSAATITSITFDAPFVHFESSAKLTGATPGRLVVFNGVVSGDSSVRFSNCLVTFANASQLSEHPEWFYANLTNDAATNTPLMNAWLAAGGGAFILPPGNWAYTGSLPYPGGPFIGLGTVNGSQDGFQFSSSSSGSIGSLAVASTITATSISLAEGGIDASGAITGSQITLDNASIDTSGNLNTDGAGGFGGSLSVGGAIHADDSIESGVDVIAQGTVFGLNVHAGGPIVSGVDSGQSDGSITSRGGAATPFKVAGNIFYTTGGDATLPAVTLVNVGDTVKIIAATTRVTGLDFVDLRIDIGGQIVFQVNDTFNFLSAVILVEVTRTGTNTANSAGWVILDDSNGPVNAVPNVRSAVPVTWANVNTVAFVATGGSFTKTLLKGDLFPV